MCSVLLWPCLLFRGQSNSWGDMAFHGSPTAAETAALSVAVLAAQSQVCSTCDCRVAWRHEAACAAPLHARSPEVAAHAEVARRLWISDTIRSALADASAAHLLLKTGA
jgi:hypothetical protein